MIKSILGLVKPDSGIIEFDGEKLNGNCNYRKSLGYMPQTARFPENLKVREILRFVRDLRGNPEQTDNELKHAMMMSVN